MFVVVDIYNPNRKKTNKKPLTGSISFNKKKSNANRTNVITSTNDNTSKKPFPSPFNKIQSIVASISKTKSKHKKSTSLNSKGEQLQNISASSILHVDHDSPKPSLCARPFSQFIFPVKEAEEEEEDDVFVIDAPAKRKLNKHHSMTQQKQTTTQRHSITLDYFNQDRHQYSTPSSSRSSSLKTIRTSEADMEDTARFYDPNSALSRSLSQNNRFSIASVTRARTVLSFVEPYKSRGNQPIHVWKNNMSQLSQEEEEKHATTDKDLYHILSHPALIHDEKLEQQRFVRQPKTLNSHAMIKFILNELITTEKSYNQLLKLIKDRYMQPMEAASQAKDPLVKSTDIPILFNHLLDLVDLSDRLLKQFESTTNNVGLIFRSLESDLVVFLKYAMHYRANIKTIRRACNNVLFIKIDQENLSRRDTNRLGMSDYFIAPIQRIPRYCLLLQDLQKYVDPQDVYSADLILALTILKGLAVAMDSAQGKTSVIPNSSIRTF